MKSHALVTLLQKGLQYHEIETSLAQVCLKSLPDRARRRSPHDRAAPNDQKQKQVGELTSEPNDSIFYFGTTATGQEVQSAALSGSGRSLREGELATNSKSLIERDMSPPKVAQEQPQSRRSPEPNGMVIDTDDVHKPPRSPKRHRPSHGLVANDAMDIDRDPSQDDRTIEVATTKAATLATANANATTTNGTAGSDPTGRGEPATGVTPAAPPPPGTTAPTTAGVLSPRSAPPPPPLLKPSTATGGGPAGHPAAPPQSGTLDPTGASPEDTGRNLQKIAIEPTNGLHSTGPVAQAINQLAIDIDSIRPLRMENVGTQMESTADLTTESTQLALEDRRSGRVQHCAWNPTDPSMLVTAGSEALCRIWSLFGSDGRVPSTSLADDLSDERNGANGIPAHATYIDLPSRAGRESWMVSAIAWSPDGQQLAVGMGDPDEIHTGEVTTWSNSGAIITRLHVGYDAIIRLCWNDSGTVLLGICGAAWWNHIVLWDASMGTVVEVAQTKDPLEDAVWISPTNFLVTGGSALTLYTLDTANTGVTAVDTIRTIGTINQGDLWMARYDRASQTIVTCTHGYQVDLWALPERSHLMTYTGHCDQITALEWQPVLKPKLETIRPRLFATGSLDGRVRIFDPQNASTLHNLTFRDTSSSMATNGTDSEGHEQVLALAFSPSGAHIAAVNAYGLVLVWHVIHGGLPRASWWGASKKAFRDALTISTNGIVGTIINGHTETNGVTNGNGVAPAHGDHDDENGDDHKLTWSADGNRLAYTMNRQVMSFSPRSERAVANRR